MIRDALLAATCVLACACGAGDDEGALVLQHDFAPVHVAAGEELETLCLAWRLDNTEPLFVNSVAMDAGPGWHHSNWFYVPEGTLSEADGSWDCSGEFDEVAAALSGGVLFAQSTQVTSETQAFADGAVLEVPPHSAVVGQVHVINASEVALDATLGLTLTGIPEEDIVTRLHPMAFDFHQLAIPPEQRSRFETDCDLEEAFGAPIDFSVHYLLPHYHQLGRGMDVTAFGGTRDGETIFSARADIGEPLGETMTPPRSLTGAQGVRFSCEFDNTTSRTVGFGNRGGEMCMLLAFTDSAAVFGGGVLEGQATLAGTDDDGVAVYRAPCTTYSILR